ncbi:patatin-like phospholipase family protein [Polycladomyces abyssicola]|uniref:patatin-like phospholipase family protein n=1 Tax=Polycladomyces abyssicola TaxID=1125966 RepID=UPI001BB2DEAA|nr:patatin-like phospholipase family protein [Polycladomyces abyssicola]
MTVWADAVFEGGGVKAIGLVGALTVAEEKGYRWKRLAGTSAGSIIAALLAAGYRAGDIHALMMEQDFLQFMPKTWYHRIPYMGPALRLWIHKGLYPGDALEKWIGELLARRGVYTFADLKECKLSIIASDISGGKLMVLPHDYKDYGYDPSELTVARAVRMSCSIPYFFDPVKVVNQICKKICYVVDGAILSNFPVWLFDQEKPRWPTFGFRLVSELTAEEHHVSGPISLLRAIFFTMMEAHDNRYLRDQEKVRTILVPTLNVKMIDFHISKEKRQLLFEEGRKAAEDFFSNWTFAEYLAVRQAKRGVSYTIRPTESG